MRMSLTETLRNEEAQCKLMVVGRFLGLLFLLLHVFVITPCNRRLLLGG